MRPFWSEAILVEAILGGVILFRGPFWLESNMITFQIILQVVNVNYKNLQVTIKTHNWKLHFALVLIIWVAFPGEILAMTNSNNIIIPCLEVKEAWVEVVRLTVYYT